MCIKALQCDSHPHPPLSRISLFLEETRKGALGSGRSCAAELCNCFEFCLSFVLWHWCVISLFCSLTELSPQPRCCTLENLAHFIRKKREHTGNVFQSIIINLIALHLCCIHTSQTQAGLITTTLLSLRSWMRLFIWNHNFFLFFFKWFLLSGLVAHLLLYSSLAP